MSQSSTLTSKQPKLEPFVVGSDIDADQTIDEVIRKYDLGALRYGPMRHIRTGHAKLLHLLERHKENEPVRKALIEKWRNAIGQLSWERHARKNHIFIDSASSWDEDYIRELTDDQLMWELVTHQGFFGELTLPEGETLYLPVIKPNVVDGKSGKPLVAEKKLYWWAESVKERITTGNRVTPLVDGEDTFRAIYQAIAGARDYVFLTSWALELDFSMLRTPRDFSRSSLSAMIKKLTSRKHPVEFYLMVWDGVFVAQGPKVSDGDVRDSIGLAGTPHVHLVLDEPPTVIDSHHQKTVVVDGKVAFCGGFDLSFMFYDRWDTPLHTPGDPRRNFHHRFWWDWMVSSDVMQQVPRDGGWHDMHAKIEGPAVESVDANFRQRWAEAADRGAKCTVTHTVPEVVDDSGGAEAPEAEADSDAEHSLPDLPPLPQAGRDSGGSHIAQVVRTYPSTKEQSVKEIYLQAIDNARRYIYIENQYFNDPDIKEALKKAIIGGNVRKDFFSDEFRIVVVLPIHYEEMADTTDPSKFVAKFHGSYTEVEKWQEVVEEIASVDENGFFGVYCLANGVREETVDDKKILLGHPIYVHAKMMIVDDIWYTIGSANTGSRSFERDTELNVAAMDESVASVGELDRRSGKDAGFRTAAMQLRLQLWEEHLKIAGDALIDWREGADLFKEYAAANLADPANAKGHVFPLSEQTKSKIDFTSRAPFSPEPPLDEAFVENLDAQTRKRLAETYAPHLAFHTRERYFPLSVLPILELSSLERVEWHKTTRLKSGNIGDADLQKWNTKDHQLDITEARNLRAKIQGTKENRVVYYRAFKQRKHGRNHIVVQYWFFYLDSLGEQTVRNDITQHDGDWEFAQIVLDESEKPLSLGCSIHYYGEARKWDPKFVEIATGAHPRIYVASRAHACHFSKGRFKTYEDMENRFTETDYFVKGGWDHTGDKKSWNYPGDYRLVDLTDETWASWKGHFGGWRAGPLPDGPRSPKYRGPEKDADNSKFGMWDYPLTWQEEFLKPEYRNGTVLSD